MASVAGISLNVTRAERHHRREWMYELYLVGLSPSIDMYHRTLSADGQSATGYIYNLRCVHNRGLGDCSE
ncbi:MAG: hypothetical protein L0L41_07680 [Acetobacter sp.]|nr:hypothetical protein [Acetobacter sp.]